MFTAHLSVALWNLQARSGELPIHSEKRPL